METLYPIGNDQGTIIINKLNDIATALNIIKVNGVGGTEATLSVTENTRTLLNQLFGDGVILPANTRNYGDVLTVVDNSNHIDWESLPEQLPAHDTNNNSSDANKLLAVQNNGTLGWTELSVGDTLPTYDNSNNSTDANKVLTILQNGSLDWENLPEELPSYNNYDNGKVLTVTNADNNRVNLSWEEIDALPAYDFEDNNGYALTIDGQNETLTWSSILPPVINNNGNYLLAHDRERQVYWAEVDLDSLDPSSILPSYRNDYDDYVLTVQVSHNESYLEWLPVPEPDCFPSWNDGEDDGKVLMIDGCNSPVWGEILPTHDTSLQERDDGKILTINGTNLEWENLPEELPSHSISDSGKVLTILNSGGLGWRMPSSSESSGGGGGGVSLPSYNQYDGGKVLAIDSDEGDLAWKEALTFDYLSNLTGFPISEPTSKYCYLGVQGSTCDYVWLDVETIIPTCNTANWLLVNTLDGPAWKSPSDVQDLIIAQVQSVQ